VPESTLLISRDSLCDFGRRLLEAAGVPAPKALLVADALVAANLRAVDSHGVQLLPYYLEQIAAGNIDPHTDGRVVSESGGCVLYDGQNGFGYTVAENCCGHVIRLAKQHGLAMAVARDSNHFGAAAFWAQKISAAGCIGIVMCNASPIVPPWQGREGRLGTNPICMAVPGASAKGWLLDMATTTVAMGKVYKAFFSGQAEIPSGWAMDSEGVPTTNTETAFHGLLMPLGGYKGYGLSMMVEILCAVLSGGAMSTEVGGIRILDRPMRTSQAFLAIDVPRFLPVEEFQRRLDGLIAGMKSAKPAAGYEEVLVAGDPEWRAEEVRASEGIPLAEGVWKKLLESAERLGVGVPAVTALPCA
jgi:LDH2 family malate/lactate/ureidoglycolate dehydrogenase